MGLDSQVGRGSCISRLRSRLVPFQNPKTPDAAKDIIPKMQPRSGTFFLSKPAMEILVRRGRYWFKPASLQTIHSDHAWGQSVSDNPSSFQLYAGRSAGPTAGATASFPAGPLGGLSSRLSCHRYSAWIAICQDILDYPRARCV